MDSDPLDGLEEYQGLTTLYQYHYRNLAVADAIGRQGQEGPAGGFARLLTDDEAEFLSKAIARLRDYMLMEEAYQNPLPRDREPPNQYTLEEIDTLGETVEASMMLEVNFGETVENIAAKQQVAIDTIKQVRDDLDALEQKMRVFGVRIVHCDRSLWGDGNGTPSKIVDDHIHTYLDRSPLRDNGWYPEGADPLREDEDERMWEAATDESNSDYSYDFLNPDPVVSGIAWSEAVQQATSEVDNGTYFSRARAWTMRELEVLRRDTLRTYYFRSRGGQVRALIANAEVHTVAADAVDVLRKAARDTGDEGQRFGEHNEWVPCYHDSVVTELHRNPPPSLDLQDDAIAYWKGRFDEEVESREGPANDLFAWRLAVLHLRMLRRMNRKVDPALVDRNVPITDGFDMPSLVQNVAHMIKYRRCVKWAKSMYKTVGLGSLHDQYRGKLLNREFAHAHQDESNTELGIARRMIRQAHVHNWVTHLSKYYSDTSTHIGKFKWSFDRATNTITSDVNFDDKSTYRIYQPEAYLTNPPMAPILCSAPPRMGKSALSLLMASFCIKMGGYAYFGVAPNKHLPKEAIQGKINALRWSAQGMPKEAIHLYSEDVVGDMEETNARLYELGSSMSAWVLHIRDEAQNTLKQEKKIKSRMNELTPVFYGLNMCVSATLLPVCMNVGLTGSAASVHDLLSTFVIRDWCFSDPSDSISRTALEKCVVKQPWSFPIGPDVLVPAKGYFPTVYPNDMDDDEDDWYKEFYTEGGSIERLTNYYGTWFHLQEYRNGERYLKSKNYVLIDDSLEHSISKLNQAKPRRDSENENDDPYGLDAAYVRFLQGFNATNRQYFDEANGRWMMGGRLRVVNAPIQSLTEDAAWVLQHATEWMDELPQKNLNGTGFLYPMLITSPHDKVQYKNGRIEWAILLCKVAWLRMHKDYVRGIIKRDTRPDELARRYGLTVLVYTGYKDVFKHYVSSPDDTDVSSESRLVAITFDPCLPENRFVNHLLTAKEADGTNSYEPGTMLPNVVVPLLDAQAYADYMAELDHDKTLSADDFLRGKGRGTLEQGPDAGRRLRNKLYRFDATRCYKRGLDTPTEDVQPYPQGGDYGNVETYNTPPVDPSPSATGADAGGAEPMDLVDQEWEDAWPNGPDDPERRGDQAYIEDDAVVDCVPDPDDPLGADGPPPLTDLNGIALRLCSTGFKNAQDATRASHQNCNIVKIAAVGYQMFEAGLTLQSTFSATNSAGVQQTHMFVPKYMSVAVPSEDMQMDGDVARNRAPDLSSLYQLIGRGFVDMKKTVLPSNWKLNLLSQKGARKLCKLYGNAELLFSQIGNESIEGRKLTLGTVLGKMPWRDDILDRRIKRAEIGEATANSNSPDLQTLLTVVDDHSRPFRNLRYCLNGKKGHWQGPHALNELAPDDLIDEGAAVAHANVDVVVRRMLDPTNPGRSDPIVRFLGIRTMDLQEPLYGDMVLDENLELKRYERVVTRGICVGTLEQREAQHKAYLDSEQERALIEERARQQPHPCADGDGGAGVQPPDADGDDDQEQAQANDNQQPVQGIQLVAELSDYSSESDSP